jgi:hypothetical protein
MASLFALGLMSVTWMIVIAGLIAVEKLLPSKALANHAVASVLVILGLGVALAPTDVPALTLPGAPAAMHSMGTHSMGSTGTRSVGGMGTHGMGAGDSAKHAAGVGSSGTRGSGTRGSAMPAPGEQRMSSGGMPDVRASGH